MTITKAIQIADENRPNAYSDSLKTLWLSELDGKIAAEIMLMSVEDQGQFNYSELENPMGVTLLAGFPYDSIYVKYLIAKIDEMNGEFESYGNNAAIFNDAYGEYCRWFLSTYDPVQGESDIPTYYISAYSLAVLQGFNGSLDEWLASLRGERGYAGDSVFVKYAETEPQQDSDMTDTPLRWMGICVQNSEIPAPESYTAYRWYDRGIRSDVRSFNGRSGTVTFLAEDIPDGSVGSGKIENGAVGENQIADNAVAGEKIQSSAVTGAKLASNAVTEGKIASSAVTTAKIASSAVTGAKIASGAVSTVYTATLPLTGAWIVDETGEMAYKEVSVSGILASDSPILDVVLPLSDEDAAEQLEQWSHIRKAVSYDGSVRFYAADVPFPTEPGASLTVKLLCIRK